MESLHELLETAARENGDAALWYEALLANEVFVITDGREREENEERGTIGFASWEKTDGTLVIPVYSSLQILQDCVREDTPYLPLSCLDFFSIVRGSYVMLDANENGGYEFSPQQIASILAAAQAVAEADEEAKKLPSVTPEEVEAELTACFKKDARVKKAYLTHALEGRLTVALECDAEEYEEIRAKAAWVLKDLLGPEAQAEVVHVASSSAMSRLVQDIAPFYRKKWLGLF